MVRGCRGAMAFSAARFLFVMIASPVMTMRPSSSGGTRAAGYAKKQKAAGGSQRPQGFDRRCLLLGQLAHQANAKAAALVEGRPRDGPLCELVAADQRHVAVHGERALV